MSRDPAVQTPATTAGRAAAGGPRRRAPRALEDPSRRYEGTGPDVTARLRRIER